MESRLTPFAALALALLALMCAGAGGAAEEGPYPIWWSPLLEIESLDEIDARLQRDRRPGMSDVMAYKQVGDEEVSATMNNCAAVIRLTDEGYEVRGYNDFKVQMKEAAWCRAIESLNHAQPAKRSFVRSFQLDHSVMNVLPLIAQIGPSCYGACWNHVGNEKRISWNYLEDFYTVERSRKNEIKIGDKVDRYQFNLLARADFNSDGLEDIVLVVNYYTTEGTYAVTYMFILTRDSSDGVFWAPDPDRYLCPDYEGRGPYDFSKTKRASTPGAAEAPGR